MGRAVKTAIRRAPKVHPTAVIHPEAILADDVEVGPFSFIGPGVRIGAGTRVAGHAVVQGRTSIGEGNSIYPFTCLGSHPQDLKYQGEDTELVIGDGNVIREGVTVNIGTGFGGGRTVIGHRNLLMACAHVAHDCALGDEVILSNGVLLGGHVKVDSQAILSGGVLVHHFVTIGRHAFVSGGTRVSHDVPPFMIVQGERQSVKCVNGVGLRRRGFEREEIERLKEAHRLLWRTRMLRAGAIAELRARFPDDPHIRLLVEALEASARGVKGRALEAFRRDHPPENGGDESGQGP